MSRQVYRISDNKVLWQVLKHLDRPDREYSIKDIAKKFDLYEREVMTLINFLNHYHTAFEVDFNKKRLKSPRSPQWSQLHLSLLEWVVFQSYFPLLTEFESRKKNPFVRKKLNDLEEKYNKHNLYQILASHYPHLLKLGARKMKKTT